MKLIEALQSALKMEIRPVSRGSEYLEAVVQREDLDLLLSLIQVHIGPAAADSTQKAVFPSEVQRLVEALGGIRTGQSLFYREEEDRRILFATLWPWESNPGKITLKAGSVLISDLN